MRKILPIILLITFNSFAQESKVVWKTLKDKNYSISYPSDWHTSSNNPMTVFTIMSELEDENDIFSENINLIIQDLTEFKMDLQTFSQISKEQIEKYITDYHLIEYSKLESKNGEYYKINYTGKQGIYNINYIQYFWLEKDIAYILTFVNELDKGNMYKATAEKMMDSFRFK